MVTAFVAHQAGWRAAFLLPGIACAAVGLAWLCVLWHDATVQRSLRPFPMIPRHLVRRAVIVLMLIAIVSGLVFNAFTLLLPKLFEERLASRPELLPLVGAAAFVATLFGALTQFTVGRMIDRTTLKRVFLPVSVILVPALIAISYAQGWIVVPIAGLVAAAIFGQVTVN